MGRHRGPTVWTWYYPFSDANPRAVREQLAGPGHAEGAETIVTDLEHAHPDARAKIDHIDVAFWGHGMIRPRVGAPCGAERLAPVAPPGRRPFSPRVLCGVPVV